MLEVSAAGFWSYAHDDDEDDGGRITLLATHVRNEFSIQTDLTLSLFLDRDSLEWGDEWRGQIDKSLEATTFLIFIATPRFFRRQECRDELLRFHRTASAEGLSKLILPIYYVPVQGLADSADEAISVFLQTQFEDWRDLRFSDPESSEYRRGVKRIVERIVAISAEFSEVQPDPGKPDEEQDSDSHAGRRSRSTSFDTPTTGGVELSIHEMRDMLNVATTTLDDVTSLAQQAWIAVRQYPPFVERPLGGLSLAERLSHPSMRLEGLGAFYASELSRLDRDVAATLRSIAGESRDTGSSIADTGASVEERQLVHSIRALVKFGRETVPSFEELATTLRGSAELSRELRPAAAAIQRGVRAILDGVSILNGWNRLMVTIGLHRWFDED
jgi:hypothetical protein